MNRAIYRRNVSEGGRNAVTHALRGEERDAADGRTEGAKAHLQPIIIQVGRKCCDHMHGGEAGGGGGEGGERRGGSNTAPHKRQ